MKNKQEVKQDAFRYDFTFKELFYFLFTKKICPKCGWVMDKRKDYETAKGSEFNSKSSAFFIPHAKVKHYIYSFTCPKCGSQYTLKELVNK